MSDSKSTDHWNVLARLLGAAPAEAPEKEAGMPEPAAAELVGEGPGVEPALEREMTAEPDARGESDAMVEAAPRFEPAAVEVREPARPAPKSEPRRTPAKPKPMNHWRELAGSLGIEVTEPEPEPEPVLEVKEADSPVAPPPAKAPGHTERADDRSRIAGSEREPERAERGFEAGMRSRSAPRRESRRASLFEDPNLSLDTPGVLDAIFDEVEPEMADERPALAAPPPEEIRESREFREVRSERVEKFVPREREPNLAFSDESADEDVDERVGEAVTDQSESETPRDADEEDRLNRRRKRRPRRRGGRRDQKPATETSRGEGGEEGIEEEDEARVERRSDATELRERRPVAPADELEDLDDDAEEQLLEDDEDDEEGGSERLRLKHKKIPTWQQAIDAIVAVNMESRAKNPGGGQGGRGRGRRWRR
jgi:hypothetical protein